MLAAMFLAALMPAVAQTPAKQLTIVIPVLQQYEDGPPLPDSHPFIPGEMVFFSFMVRNYQLSTSQRVRLTYRVEAADSAGVLLSQSALGKVDTEVGDMDKDWLPKVRYSTVIPPHALSGQYRIAAWVRDEQSGREARSEVPFTVRSRVIQLSDTLSVQDFRFLRTEEDRDPLITPIYKAGDTLWARFDITGFKIAGKNRLDVAYGIAIADSSGKVLFSQPEAATEQDAPFYPKRYVPATFSLNVQPKTAPGEYALIVSARDQIGGQTCESRQTFRVE